MNQALLGTSYVVFLPISLRRVMEALGGIQRPTGLGREFWVLMASTFAANLMGQGVFAHLPYHLVDIGGSATIMGIVLTVGSFVVAFMSPVGGYVGDVYGRRKMLIFSPVIASVGWFVLAMSGDWAAAALGFSLVQAPGTIAAPAMSAYIGDVVPEEKLGRAYGVLGSVLNVTAVVGPVLVGVLIDTYGFQAALLVVGVMTLLSAILRLLLKETIPPGGELQWRSIPRRMRASLRSPTIRYSVAVQTTYLAAFGFSYSLVPVVLKSVYGYDPPTVGLIQSFRNLVFAAVSPLGGRMTETGNRHAMLAVNTAGRMAFLVLFAYYGSLPALLAAVALESIATPFLIPMSDSFIARATRKEERGTMFGFLRSWIALGQAPATPTGGYLFDNVGYRSPFLVSAALMIPVAAYAITALPSERQIDQGPMG